MAKRRKGNKEVKKPKADAGKTKQQKKALRRHDGAVSELLGGLE